MLPPLLSNSNKHFPGVSKTFWYIHLFEGLFAVFCFRLLHFLHRDGFSHRAL